MTHRTPVMAGNWKMYKTPSEGAAFVEALAPSLAGTTGVQVLVAPPFTGLSAAVEAARGTVIEVSAQDCFWEREGAYTGEVAPAMLSDLGVGWVIVGHSERRQLFGETDQAVARKVKAAVEQGLQVILCVGETEKERDEGLTEERLVSQVGKGLADLPAGSSAAVTIAYEPVWAIGTGRTATPAQAQEACALIRARVTHLLGGETGQAMRILYGGSVKPGNVAELMQQPDIDGGLVGGASLEVDSFVALVRAAG